jgi:hypothetical protein
LLHPEAPLFNVFFVTDQRSWELIVQMRCQEKIGNALIDSRIKVHFDPYELEWEFFWVDKIVI